MPISDTSTMTSLTASPMEPHDSKDLPIEVSIPLHMSTSKPNQDLSQPEKPSHDHDPQDGEPAKKDADFRDSADTVQEFIDIDTPSKMTNEEEPKPPSISLGELTGLAQEEQYEKSRATCLRAEAERLALSNGLNRRLNDTLSIAYGNMIDQFKGDDQAGFTGLFEASERLVSHSKPIDRNNSSEENPDVEGSFPDSLPRENARPLLYELPLEDQDSVVFFLNKIRTDLDYLADLISDLPSPELTSLTSSYHPAGVELSVLPNHSHGRTQAYSRDSQMMKLSRRMDSIDRFHNQDPYFTLLYGVFDSSSPIGSSEYDRKMKVWARTCARVMTEGKVGSEEFAVASIDSFVDTKTWAMKLDMEIYLLDVLTEGYFLLDPPLESSPEKPDSMETDTASHAIAIAEFFDKHTRKLLNMLTARSNIDAVPLGVLNFIHAILHEIKDGQMRELAKKFIVSRWYFASFLSSVLVYPEVQGMLLNHHIGQSARRTILKELVLRLQSQMFAVLAPSSSFTFVMPEVQDQLFQIIEYFDHPISRETWSIARNIASWDGYPQPLMLSHWDIIGLVEALHPTPAHAPPGMDSSSAKPGHPLSSASSVTLHPGNTDVGSNELSSANRSYAASSSTDGTMVAEVLTSTEKAGQSDPPHVTPNTEHMDPVPLLENDIILPERLSNVCIRLKDLGRSQARSTTTAQPQNWIFFEISSRNSDLKLSNGLSQPVTRKPSPSAAKVHISQENEVSKKYASVKNALLALLVSREARSDIGPNAMSSSLGISEDFLQPLIRKRMDTAHSQHDFLVANQWSRTLQAYRDLQGVEPFGAFHRNIVQDIADGLRASIQDSVRQREATEAAMRLLDFRRQQIDLEELTVRRRKLRIKMWYISDVKNSSLYEDILRVTKALRTMAIPKRAKPTSGLASWARQRLRGANPYDRADKQALEAMCAQRDHGGVAKLGDEQVHLTLKWLTKNNIENFCEGEERIHRFCYEVQKAVNKLAGVSMLDSPVLWSSHLFRKEKATFDTRPRQSNFSPSLPSPLSPPLRSHDLNGLRSPYTGYASSTFPNTSETRGKGPMELSGGLQITSIPHHSGQSFMNGNPRYPYPSISASQAFGHLSPPMTPLSPKISEVFSASIPNKPEPVSRPKAEFVEGLKIGLLGLVISDLGYLLWTHGSETDIWVQRAAAQGNNSLFLEKLKKNAEAVSTSEAANLPVEQDSSGPVHGNKYIQQTSPIKETDDLKLLDEEKTASIDLSYTNAYTKLLQAMTLSQDPYVKLQKLCQLEDLVIDSLQDEGIQQAASHGQSLHPLHKDIPAANPSRTIPRTKATKMEEVVANCTERRAGTMKRKQKRSPFPVAFLDQEQFTYSSIGADQIVDKLLSVIRDNSLRPRTLFRDLQYIAAFVPSATLDQTAQGKAFWDVALAAMALKEDLTNSTVQRAHEITNYHITSKKSTQTSEDNDIPAWLASTTLHDAAQLWITAAKEGSPVAARELALFYLTHPDLLRRVTAPFSEAKDVFGSLSFHNRTSSGALDPLTFSVVLHWMGIAANGGDKEAKDFLRDNGALGFH